MGTVTQAWSLRDAAQISIASLRRSAGRRQSYASLLTLTAAQVARTASQAPVHSGPVLNLVPVPLATQLPTVAPGTPATTAAVLACPGPTRLGPASKSLCGNIRQEPERSRRRLFPWPRRNDSPSSSGSSLPAPRQVGPAQAPQALVAALGERALPEAATVPTPEAQAATEGAARPEGSAEAPAGQREGQSVTALRQNRAWACARWMEAHPATVLSRRRATTGASVTAGRIHVRATA